MNHLRDAVLNGDLLNMRQAISEKSNVNEIDGSMTPLLWAIMRGDTAAVKLLLESGADPNLSPDGEYNCPLWSAEDDFGLFEIAELLKTYGAVKPSLRKAWNAPE